MWGADSGVFLVTAALTVASFHRAHLYPAIFFSGLCPRQQPHLGALVGTRGRMARNTRGKRVRAVFEYDSDGELVENFGNVDEGISDTYVDPLDSNGEEDVSDGLSDGDGPLLPPEATPVLPFDDPDDNSSGSSDDEGNPAPPAFPDVDGSSSERTTSSRSKTKAPAEPSTASQGMHGPKMTAAAMAELRKAMLVYIVYDIKYTQTETDRPEAPAKSVLASS